MFPKSYHSCIFGQNVLSLTQASLSAVRITLSGLLHMLAAVKISLSRLFHMFAAVRITLSRLVHMLADVR